MYPPTFEPTAASSAPAASAIPDSFTLPTPFPVELTTHGHWFDTFVGPVGALAGALLGGVIAYASIRASDRRKREADDRRQWDQSILETFINIDSATAVFYDSRDFNSGDARHLSGHVPKMDAALLKMKSKRQMLRIVAPGTLCALDRLIKAAEEALGDAQRASPMRPGVFDEAHEEFGRAVQRQLRVREEEKASAPDDSE